MREVDKYRYLWEPVDGDWALLEIGNDDEQTRRYMIWNLRRPEEQPEVEPWHLAEVHSVMLDAGSKIIQLNQKLADPVREYCRQRGFGSRTIRGGRTYLISSWERFVDSVATDLVHDRSEYLNGVDGRHIVFGLHEKNFLKDRDLGRLFIADNLFRKSVRTTTECLWGQRFAEKYNLDPRTHWYYFSWPQTKA